MPSVTDTLCTFAMPRVGCATIVPSGCGCGGGGTFVKLASFPPKPNVAPHGLFSHFGAWRWGAGCPSRAGGGPKSSRLYMHTFPSNDAVDRMPGTSGLHLTSKFQLLPAELSATTDPCDMSQQSVRLSFPLVSNMFGSPGAPHAMESTPLWCPCSSFRGLMELRRSHTCSDGDLSSSLATTSCVATSGFHCSAEHRRFMLGSLKLMTGFCRLRSQTTVVPDVDVDARMCCTFRFHARNDVSAPATEAAPSDAAPLSAGYRLGELTLATSQMHKSLSAAPDASKLGLNALNSSPRTAEVCWFSLATTAPLAALSPFASSEDVAVPTTLDGSYSSTVPSTSPPAMMPSECVSLSMPVVPHASL
mmetsp:Transcript_14440/g.36172  ORF Transcript_14440/g.36172 Transcript_14440/m.36172 type:complete len:361 (+) Transcript_14440:2369-3451(+)